MSDPEQKPYSRDLLEAIYKTLKTEFDKRLTGMAGTGPMSRFTVPPELKEEAVGDIISGTNNSMADAASNNIREEIHGASRQANLLLSMARDSHGALRPRLAQINNYLTYVDRAVYEGDPEDPTDSDGMLLAGIRRVEL